jgi:hypothetical protein
VPGQPMPLLPAIGGAASRVVAEFEAPAHVRPARSVRTASPAQAQVVAMPSAPAQHVVTPRPTHKPHRAHRPRVRVVRPTAPAPVQVAAQAPVPATPVTTHRFSAAPKAKGKAYGHSHALKPRAVGGQRQGHGKALGQGKAHGRSTEHHQGPPPGQAKKAPTAPPAAPPKANGGGPPAEHGGGNGHKGGKK